MVDRDTILQYLPAYNGAVLDIKDDQDVSDIMKEVIDAHKYFSSDYLNIVEFFYEDNLQYFLKNLFNFCKANIKYKIESEENQRTKSPAALLTIGAGDCKHYAGFIAGNLCAAEMLYDKKIDWCYRFASYEILSDVPGHVFVVVKLNGHEIWVDPVLDSYDSRKYMPTSFIDKKINCKKMLQRLSGVGEAIPQKLVDSIMVLNNYSLIDPGQKKLDKYRYAALIDQLPFKQAQQLQDAYNFFEVNATATGIGSFWTGLWDVVTNVLGGGNNPGPTTCPICQICPPVKSPIETALPFMLGAGLLGFVLAKKNIF